MTGFAARPIFMIAAGVVALVLANMSPEEAHAQALTPDAKTQAASAPSSMTHGPLRIRRAPGGPRGRSDAATGSQTASATETVAACYPGHETSSEGPSGMAKVITAHSWNGCTYPVLAS